ncbi:MAG: T9SS type A sorting domain-containing protein [Bacteroidales bacterium]|nr:T9SS type A sorting domain-containing protein [Bacteroidales bacterium]
MYFSGASNPGTGIFNLSKNTQTLRIYPNPFSTYFEVENFFDCDLSLKLFDLMGQLLEEFNLSGNSSCQIQPEQSLGIYFYIISDNRGKLIRQ